MFCSKKKYFAGWTVERKTQLGTSSDAEIMILKQWELICNTRKLVMIQVFWMCGCVANAVVFC